MNPKEIITLLGLDVGTTSTKAVLYDLAGEELARSVSAPYHLHTPQPNWAEQDPKELWQAVLTALRGVMSQAGDDVQVAALCMAAQSGSLLPADEYGDPVYPLITWMDGRTEELVNRWRDAGIDARVKSLSGWSLYPGLCLPTIAWLQENDPETFVAARHYFSVNDFIAYLLTGKMVSNPSNGGGMQLVDIQTANWQEDLCAVAGITPEQLSRIQLSGSIIGEVRPEICQETGLTPGSVLVNGGHDQGCTAMGLGINDPGKFLLSCGTAWVFTGMTDSPDMDRIPDALDMNFHITPNRWTISQSLGGLGASLEWWVGQAWIGSRQDKFAALDQELGKSQPNKRLFFTPLTGGHDDPATTRSGCFVGLQLVHQRRDMARAIMESAGYELRWALDIMKATEMPIDGLWMVGGAANSSHWPLILANITGLPISLPDYDNWPALGAAVLAGVGVGLFENIVEGLVQLRKPVRELQPDSESMVLYNENFEMYKTYCATGRQLSKGH
jgi:xylulokinase